MTDAKGVATAITNERGKTHGDWSEHAATTQAIMDVCMAGRSWPRLTTMQREFLHMNAHKIGRIVTGNPDVADHYDDISGYAHITSIRLESGRKAWEEAGGETQTVVSVDHRNISKRIVEALSRDVAAPTQRSAPSHSVDGTIRYRDGDPVTELVADAAGASVGSAEYDRLAIAVDPVQRAIAKLTTYARAMYPAGGWRTLVNAANQQFDTPLDQKIVDGIILAVATGGPGTPEDGGQHEGQEAAAGQQPGPAPVEPSPPAPSTGDDIVRSPALHLIDDEDTVVPYSYSTPPPAEISEYYTRHAPQVWQLSEIVRIEVTAADRVMPSAVRRWYLTSQYHGQFILILDRRRLGSDDLAQMHRTPIEVNWVEYNQLPDDKRVLYVRPGDGTFKMIQGFIKGWGK